MIEGQLFGYCVYLGLNLVSLRSKKQVAVFRSSTKSEYWAFAMATSKVLWIRLLLIELDIVPLSTLIIWSDNQSVTALAGNPKFHS